MSDGYERFSERSDKLRVRGFKRAVLDLASEATTLGTGAAVVMLALALPAFRETSENWLKSQELAVTFLDRYGKEIGRRGIRHDDSVKLEEFPDYLIKAALATEDRRFFEHFGIDPIGTFRALSVNARGGGVVQGGSSITQQLAKNLFLTNERTLERKVKEAFLAVWLEFASLEAGHPQALSRPRLHGRRHLRRRGGGGVLFRQVGEGHLARRIGDARRAVQGADANTPRTSTCRRPAPAPTTCSTTWSRRAS